MTKARNLADVGSNDVLDTSSTGVDVTGTVTADGLTVDGTAAIPVTINTSVDGAQLKFNDGTASTQPWNVGIKNDGSNDFLIYNLGAENIELYTADKLRQKVGSNGDISFYKDTGTTPKFFWDASAEGLNLGAASMPFGKLDVSDVGGSGTATIFDAGANGDNYFTAGASGIQAFRNGSTERMRIDSSGNVGIGTSSPTYELHVADTDSFAVVAIEAANNSVSHVFFGDTDQIDVGRISYEHAVNAMPFQVNGSEAMRIDSSGNVGIGTSSPAKTLDVYGGKVQRRSSTHVDVQEMRAKVINTTATTIFTAKTGNDHSGIYYEIISTGGDWGSHSAARWIIRGFVNGSDSYTGHSVVEHSQPYGTAVTKTVSWSGSTNDRTITFKLNLPTGTVTSTYTVRLVGIMTEWDIK